MMTLGPYKQRHKRKCKSCKRGVFVAHTDKETAIVLDPEPSPSGKVAVEFRDGTLHATLLTGARGEQTLIPGSYILYASHFTTCPDSNKPPPSKRKRKKKVKPS